ncbi:histidine phosphatase family protein [Actinomadura napierensis]|uniref:Histidine phosphatase family protein n=1 Tax=Actinomadura napierensis TaxID=267854 RepID=A0ABN3A7A6_9ACTN
MDDALEVVCLRHAEAENVVAGASGALPGAALTERGRVQANAVAHALPAIDHVYASTAERAWRTAETIGRVRGVGVTKMEGLVEMGIGGLEGAVDPVTRARTAEVLRSWVVDGKLDERVADGETGHAVVERVVNAFRAIAAEHRHSASASVGAVAVVGHVASLTVGLSVLCGLGSTVWGAPLPHAVPFRVLVDGRGWRCAAWPGLWPV